MGTVAQIHASLIRAYETAYQQARAQALALFGDCTAAQLRQARRELEQSPGFLGVRERAQQAAQRDVIDALIETAVLGHATEMP